MFLCFKQKTAYEMRISDWSSDVCSSDLERSIDRQQRLKLRGGGGRRVFPDAEDAAKSAAIGITHLHRLAAEDDALTIERAAEVPPDDRNPAMPSRHHHFRDFHRLRKLEAIMSVDREPARRAAIHQLL